MRGIETDWLVFPPLHLNVLWQATINHLKSVWAQRVKYILFICTWIFILCCAATTGEKKMFLAVGSIKLCRLNLLPSTATLSCISSYRLGRPQYSDEEDDGKLVSMQRLCGCSLTPGGWPLTSSSGCCECFGLVLTDDVVCFQCSLCFTNVVLPTAVICHDVIHHCSPSHPPRDVWSQNSDSVFSHLKQNPRQTNKTATLKYTVCIYWQWNKYLVVEKVNCKNKTQMLKVI